MSEHTQNQNNPTGIWQHIWVTLTMQALTEYKEKKYLACWETIKLLKAELPPECEAEIQQEYNKIKIIMKKQIPGFNQQNVVERRTAYLQAELPDPLLEIIGDIRHTLFKNNWINKNFSAKPVFEKKGHLTIPG